MYNISGYLGKCNEEIIDHESRIAINSCGHYKLSADEAFETWRPFGRQDYQLLYLAGGAADFYIDGEKTSLEAESLVFFYPGEKQQYGYRKGACSDVYWVHFSGTQAAAVLQRYGFYPEHIFTISAGNECTLLFERIIRELQLKPSGFESLLSLYIETLLLLFSRTLTRGDSAQVKSPIVEQAALYYHSEYQNPLTVQEYADKQGISCCWFIRTFKQQTGLTPLQYLTRIRVNKAIDLFNTGSFNVQEASAMIGYDDPLYFSRVFKKMMGLSPRQYLQQKNLKPAE